METVLLLSAYYFLCNWCDRQDTKLNDVQSYFRRYFSCYIKYILQHAVYIFFRRKSFLMFSFFPLLTRHLCRPCHNREKAKGLGKYICQKCHLIIDEQPLMFRNDSYHPDHFNCTHCGYVFVF